MWEQGTNGIASTLYIYDICDWFVYVMYLDMIMCIV